MASASVYYKFGAQKDVSRITFDGTGISVWDFKREVILQNRMGKGLDFDLKVSSQDGQEYKDDNLIIPRSSQVIVKRLPPARPGRGSAAQYVADLQTTGPNANVVEQTAQPARSEAMYRGPMTRRFDNSEPQETAAPVSAPAMQSIGADEGSNIQAMLDSSTAQWEEQQERMSHATYRERPGMPFRARPPSARPQQQPRPPIHDRPPPFGYVCNRCGIKGHWIYECPTNSDRDFDNRPRIRGAAGIPRSQLKAVEAPTDGSQGPVMRLHDGTYVQMQTDSAAWARAQAFRQRRMTKSDIYASVPKESSLACTVCSKLLRDAVRTPCCSVLACEECITNHLLEHEFKCPECGKRIKDLTELKRDDDVRKRVHEYVDAEMDSSEKKLEEAEKAAIEEEERAKKEKEVEEGEPEEKEQTPPQEKQEEQPWDPQPARQILMMLANPQLPPPMRMQLQMQLKMLQAQFLQNKGSSSQQQQLHLQQQQAPTIGAHNTMNPFMHGNPLMGMGMGMNMANAMQARTFAQPFRPAAPLSHHESAYMRLPVNPNKRAAQHEYGSNKRERPADFLELGGGQ